MGVCVCVCVCVHSYRIKYHGSAVQFGEWQKKYEMMNFEFSTNNI